ncbi:hypothetical protein BCY86_08880 [Pajaroellobacter abortibovis]|uniref:Uncharacterized protein n=1 Tax=Pajaroellobacter abortibovis TaxID=1882918 RepID=A0A1L6MZB1_9BACT|nr:hypothetical protein BCY86_08880 [Pajaroellobacter abortibovis]
MKNRNEPTSNTPEEEHFLALPIGQPLARKKSAEHLKRHGRGRNNLWKHIDLANSRGQAQKQIMFPTSAAPSR